MYINQALLINSFFEMSICISLAALEVHSLPIYLLISLFQVICLELLIT